MSETTTHITPGSVGLPDYSDIEAARSRLSGLAHRTPVLTSRTADAMVGGRLFFKAENLQRAGAFKFRGAANAIAALSAEARERGVLAYSSGNHAQAVALAARLRGVSATILMPHDAPAAKRAAAEGYGATVVGFDRYTQDREALAIDLAGESGATLVPPYDHRDVIAGQGTATAELIEEAGPLDAILVCLGGGGLLSGALLAAGEMAPGAAIYGVEPEAGDDGRRSLAAGRIVTIPVPRTLADGAQTTHLGALTFPIIAERAAGILTVPDPALVDAMRFFAGRMKTIVEPTGCLAAAAALSGAFDCRDKRVGVILSGGNVDLARFAALVGDG